MTGIVLYAKDKKTDFYWNKVHVKSGYIIIKKSKDLKKYQGKGIVHGPLFQCIFNEQPDNKVVAGGFARQGNVWKYRSGVCNANNNGYCDNSKAMNKTEEQYIRAAIKNWIENRKQNWKLVDPIYIHPNQ